ncbi:hypothetical protein ACFO3J_07630 [Streptomyces polygonati]|uniref:Uncharacterized protein n=1 Tax=Streptomyces polygonati TaxID=1617087 RepID=A0ABV8HKL2_9ACTN
MTPEQDLGEELRDALARSLEGYVPSAAPVDRILAAGRTRRARRRAAVLATAAVLAVGLILPLSRLAGGDTPTGPRIPAPPSRSAPATTAPAVRPQTEEVGRGTLDGQPWSVTLEFYPTWPEGFSVGPLPPGLRQQPVGGSLLCQRMFIGGVRIDHQGGPWSDCQPVDGAEDLSASGSMGLWGTHEKGTAGSRLFVSDAEPGVAYGVVTFADGTKTTAPVRTVPGTGYHAWAVAIRDGRTIAVVDEYDARHRRVSHSTEWR